MTLSLVSMTITIISMAMTLIGVSLPSAGTRSTNMFPSNQSGFRLHVRVGQPQRFAFRKRDDLLECLAEIQLEIIPFRPAKMRRADHVRHRKERVIAAGDRLVLINIDRRVPGRPARNAGSAPGWINSARDVFTSRAVGFMRARSSGPTMPRVSGRRRTCSDNTSDCANSASLLAANP